MGVRWEHAFLAMSEVRCDPGPVEVRDQTWKRVQKHELEIVP